MGYCRDMQTLAAGVSYLDLHFGERRRIIASAVLQGSEGVAIVDPGPSSTLPTLRATLAKSGIAMTDVTALLLTHIHLDHAGAAGTLVAEQPRLRVYVHERGAPHLENPEKLVASATRLYGDAMDRLWGPVRPVPKSAITAVTGERHERITAGGRPYEVAYTPGHASHHVSYFNADTGIAFVGDTAGVKLQPDGYALPPTPPPDIDLEAWRDSLARIAAWRADTLLLTHFGPVTSPDTHLEEFLDHLERIADLVKTSLDQSVVDGDDTAREAWFKDRVMRELRTRVTEAEARNYEAAGRFDLNWRGLARYWRKRATPTR